MAEIILLCLLLFIHVVNTFSSNLKILRMKNCLSNYMINSVDDLIQPNCGNNNNEKTKFPPTVKLWLVTIFNDSTKQWWPGCVYFAEYSLIIIIRFRSLHNNNYPWCPSVSLCPRKTTRATTPQNVANVGPKLRGDSGDGCWRPTRGGATRRRGRGKRQQTRAPNKSKHEN